MFEGLKTGIVENIVHMEETDSTNNQAKAYGACGEPSGTLFIADRQSDGRGRRGRKWLSEETSGIWMSILLRPQISPDKASMLTLVAAMSVADTIESISGVHCEIKWPNDIVMNDRKVCGILTEMSATPGCIDYVVIGIGINLNTKEFAPDIEHMATSVALETGRVFGREQVINVWGKSFKRYYDTFLKTGDLSALCEEYNKMLINTGRLVKLVCQDGERLAEAVGIDDRGALIVKNTDGSISCITAGEVSVRGLYGYV